MEKLFIIFVVIILFSCKRSENFKLLKRYYDESTIGYNIYTKYKDSLEILKYSENLRKKNEIKDSCHTVFIFFCNDSTNTPELTKGNIYYKGKCFAYYSNIYERLYHNKGLGRLKFIK